MVTQNTYDRITFSLPHSMNVALDNLKDEIKQSKSEIIKIALDNYLKQMQEIKLKKAVELMQREYEQNSELSELTQLDGEQFL